MTRRMGPLRLDAILAALAVLVISLLAAPVMPAHALGSPLRFSTDGVTWTSVPPEALFTDDVVLVPGGSTTATLHLRSAAPTRGALDIATTNVRASDPEAAEAFGIEVAAEAETDTGGTGDGLPRTRFADLTENTPVSPTVTLEPGQSASFTLTIDLGEETSGTAAQNSAIGLDLAIGFRDAAAGGGEGPHGTPDSGTAPPQVIHVLPPGENLPPGRGGNPVQPPAAEPAESAGTQGPSADPAATVRNQGQPADDPPASGRGLLAITGIARGAIVTALAVTALGGLLLLISRHRGEES